MNKGLEECANLVRKTGKPLLWYPYTHGRGQTNRGQGCILTICGSNAWKKCCYFPFEVVRSACDKLRHIGIGWTRAVFAESAIIICIEFEWDF
jgi:hypothetical protein